MKPVFVDAEPRRPPDGPITVRSRLTAAFSLLFPWLARPLGLFLASRVATLAAIATAARLSPGYDFRGSLTTWDGGWYLSIASDGYPATVTGDGQSPIAFFPLFPVAIRHLTGLTGLSPLRAALMLNLVAGCLAAAVIWRLVAELTDRDVADRATALFCFFPGSYVMSMIYSEPLMLALSAGCLLTLVRQRWMVAGLLAALATAVRPNAVALVLACAWAAIGAWRTQRWRSLPAPLLAPLGLLAYFAFLWRRTGEAGIWFRVQQGGWEQKFDFGATTLRHAGDVLGSPFQDINKLVGVLSLAFVLVAGTLLLRSRLPSLLTVYTAVLVALAFLSEVTGSRPRFLLTAFPLIVAVAKHTRGVTFAMTLGVSASLLVAAAMLSTSSIILTP